MLLVWNVISVACKVAGFTGSENLSIIITGSTPSIMTRSYAKSSGLRSSGTKLHALKALLDNTGCMLISDVSVIAADVITK